MKLRSFIFTEMNRMSWPSTLLVLFIIEHNHPNHTPPKPPHNKCALYSEGTSRRTNISRFLSSIILVKVYLESLFTASAKLSLELNFNVCTKVIHRNISFSATSHRLVKDSLQTILSRVKVTAFDSSWEVLQCYKNFVKPLPLFAKKM